MFIQYLLGSHNCKLTYIEKFQIKYWDMYKESKILLWRSFAYFKAMF